MISRHIARLVLATFGTISATLRGQVNRPAPPATQSSVHEDVIDATERHQTLDHFGASDAWTMKLAGGWSAESRKKLATLLFSATDGIGLTCWRFNLGGGIVQNRAAINPARTVETFELAEGKYDWTLQANDRQILADAKAMGVPIFIAFVNSPPKRMTLNGLTNSYEPRRTTQPSAATQSALTASTASTNLKPGYEEHFARYLVDILEHFRTNPEESQRITFKWVSPVNEATIDWNSGQEGCRYSDDDIKRVAWALHRELSDRNSPTKMLLVEANSYGNLVSGFRKHNAYYGDYVDVLLGDRRFAPLLGGVLAHHAYGADGRNFLSDRRAFARKMAAHGDTGVVSWMSEYCVLKGGRDLGMDYALQVARVMWGDFTISGDSAWDWWLALSNGIYEDGLLYTDYRRQGDQENIIVPKMFWAFGNYSRFVRPGMVRVDLTGDSHSLEGLEGSAWLDGKSGQVVVVYVNSSRSGQTVHVTVKSAKVSSWTPYVTSDAKDDDLRRGESAPADGNIALPPRSVVTLVGSGA